MNARHSTSTHGRGAGDVPTVTYALIAAMAIVSLPTLAHPRLYAVFGGVGTLEYPWQALTSAFEHGWPGVPLLPHLIGNLVLIWLVGPAAERLLGAWRFLVVTAAALALYVAARWLTGLEANGASVFIWAYAPIVFVGRRRLARTEDMEKYNVVLFIMWVAVPLGMGLVIALSASVGPLLALAAGNAFHASATVAGVAAALLWRRRLRETQPASETQPSRLDRTARPIALLIPVSLAALLLAALIGWI